MFHSKHTTKTIIYLTYLAHEYFADFLSFLKM